MFEAVSSTDVLRETAPGRNQDMEGFLGWWRQSAPGCVLTSLLDKGLAGKVCPGWSGEGGNSLSVVGAGNKMWATMRCEPQ